MRRLLIAAAVPRRFVWGTDPLMTDRHCRRISTTPQLSAVWRANGISHRLVGDYFAPSSWDPLHSLATRQLRKSALAADSPLQPNWLDDWSHLLVDELRQATFWGEVARRLLHRERPQEIWLQRVAPSHPLHRSFATLAVQFDGLGHPPQTWPPSPHS